MAHRRDAKYAKILINFLHYYILFFLCALSAFAVMFLGACSLYQKPVSGASPVVRVLLYQGVSVSINPLGGNYILSYNTRKEEGEGRINAGINGEDVSLNGVAIKAPMIEIYTGEGFTFAGKKYGGSAALIISNRNIMLIDSIDIESYLKGVLPGEVSSAWEGEALKSQAVASRTYALFEVVNSRKKGRFFDLYSDTRSQSYEGREKETRQTSFAVDSTQGEVLKFDGKIIQAFFHSSSGGMTESSFEVFGDYKPYLTPVESPYSSIYKDDRWEASIPLERAGRLFKITNKIISAAVTARTDSKRIRTAEFTDDTGRKTDIPGRDLREILGPALMKSTRANLRISNDNLLISGAGSGHGVGMGQWDAQGMSKQGYTYKYILAYFYRGVSIDKVW